MAYVSVIFVSGTSPLDWLVRLVTRSRFSHCYSCDTQGNAFDAQPFKGVVTHKLKYGHKIVRVRVENGQAYDRFLSKSLGAKYDFGGVLSFVLPFVRPAKNKWYCSELVMEALIAGGIGRSAFNGKKRISPKALFNDLCIITGENECL